LFFLVVDGGVDSVLVTTAAPISESPCPQ